MHSNSNKTCVDCGASIKNPKASRCKPCSLRYRHARERATLTPPNPSGLCMCGCGNPVPRAGRTSRKERVVFGEFIKFLTGHHRRLSPVDYIVDDATGCWNWQLSLDHHGYGMAYIDGKRIGAHRLIYQRERGPIPDGMPLDHLCRNPRCVNPGHLEPVTQAENVQRGNHAKLTIELACEIRRRYAEGGISLNKIGSEYGVSGTCIHNVVHNKSWST